MNEYMILTAKFKSELEEEVSNFMKLGWKPQGSVTFTVQKAGFFDMIDDFQQYSQAMIKEPNEHQL